MGGSVKKYVFVHSFTTELREPMRNIKGVIKKMAGTFARYSKYKAFMQQE